MKLKTAYSRTVTRRAMTMRYELLAGEDGYGIRVEGNGEDAVMSALSIDGEAVFSLLEAIMRGFVTPVTARDIAEDWLLR